MEIGKLKALLGIRKDDFDQDIPLQFIMDDVEEIVKNYCNLDEVPKGLTNTCYRMAMDLYRAESVGEGEAPLTVSSITEGDTATSFGSKSELVKNTLLKNYEGQLNRYRKMRW